MTKQPIKPAKIIKILALTLLPLILIAVLLKNSLAYVPPGHVGMVKTFGALSGQTLSNGMHFTLPFVHSVENVDNRVRKLDVGANAASKELQSLYITVAVNYKIKEEGLVEFIRDIGMYEFDCNILHPAVQECVKSVAARYTVDNFVIESEQVNAEIAALVESKVEKYGIDLMGFNVTELAFSDAFRTAIEEKQVAQQELLSSQARSDAAIAVAEGKAQANRLIAESLTPLFVEYLLERQKIDKWDGRLPQVSGGSAVVDFKTP